MDEPAQECEEIRWLLEQLRGGDRRAFEFLYAHHRDDLKRFLECRIDRRMQGRVDGSDVLQEAQLEAFRRIDDDDLKREPMPFGVWLKRTVYERLLMLRRRHVGAAQRTVEAEVPLPQQSSVLLAARLFASGSTPSRQAGRQELAARLHAAIVRLPEIDRENLLMRNLDELPYGEIAGILDIDAAAARKRHGRVVLRLHQLLSDGGPTGAQL